MPEIQRLHASPLFRASLHAIMLTAFVCSALSLALRKERILGTAGIAVTLTASLIGGSHASAVCSTTLRSSPR